MLKPAVLAVALLWPLSAMAGDRPDQPSLAFCLAAKAAVVAAGSEKAAEDTALAQGVSRATIAKAKRCKR